MNKSLPIALIAALIITSGMIPGTNNSASASIDTVDTAQTMETTLDQGPAESLTQPMDATNGTYFWSYSRLNLIAHVRQQMMYGYVPMGSPYLSNGVWWQYGYYA